nr:MAG TPA: hypothetical protein [Caudoviricetes sp.]
MHCLVRGRYERRKRNQTFGFGTPTVRSMDARYGVFSPGIRI